MSSTAVVQRYYNFSAGPATLPLWALKRAQEHLLCLPGVGASVLEISHRSKEFAEIIEGAEERLRRLLNLPDDYHVLFLQGGATLQFAMVAMNFLDGGKADYVLTGSWSKKAAAEAEKFGTVNVIWDGADEGYTKVPEQGELKLSEGSAYLHITSNETIQGIEYSYDYDSGDVPLVCDASSDFLHRPLDIRKYALIYAGAQKNLGPAGVTVVILRDELLQRKTRKALPVLLDYEVMAAKKSLYNTPPCFAIYMVGLVAQWLLEEIGGLEKMYQRNQAKAKLLYDCIDKSGGFYRGHAHKQHRSLMNVTFRLPTSELEQKFLEEAAMHRLMGLKGHRSVGGLRASIYNAFEPEGVKALVEFMRDFQKRYG